MPPARTLHSRRTALVAVGAFALLLAAPGVRAHPATPEGGATSTAPAAQTADLPEPVDPGVWPLSPRPRVVQRFSPPSERWGRGHRGADLAGSPAQPVVAALAGEVAFAGTIAGRGVVVVRHGATRTTYEPVVADVSPGQVVDAGSRLGWLHTTGSHCAPAACLHWGWRHGEVYLDPLDLVGGAGVRLLPLWTLPGPLPLPLQARGWAWE